MVATANQQILKTGSKHFVTFFICNTIIKFFKLKSLRLHTVYSALHSSSLELRRFQQVPNFAISVFGSSCQYLFNVHACFFAFFFYSPAFPIKARMPINRLRKKRRENEINKKVLPRKQNEHDHLVPGNTI